MSSVQKQQILNTTKPSIKGMDFTRNLTHLFYSIVLECGYSVCYQFYFVDKVLMSCKAVLGFCQNQKWTMLIVTVSHWVFLSLTYAPRFALINWKNLRQLFSGKLHSYHVFWIENSDMVYSHKCFLFEKLNTRHLKQRLRESNGAENAKYSFAFS